MIPPSQKTVSRPNEVFWWQKKFLGAPNILYFGENYWFSKWTIKRAQNPLTDACQHFSWSKYPSAEVCVNCLLVVIVSAAECKSGNSGTILTTWRHCYEQTLFYLYSSIHSFKVFSCNTWRLFINLKSFGTGITL